MRPACVIGASAIGVTAVSWYAVRSAWHGLNNAKWVGLVVVALVSYHTFDGYRASVDNAWGKVERLFENLQDLEKEKAVMKERDRANREIALARAQAAEKERARVAKEQDEILAQSQAFIDTAMERFNEIQKMEAARAAIRKRAKELDAEAAKMKAKAEAEKAKHTDMSSYTSAELAKVWVPNHKSPDVLVIKPLTPVERARAELARAKAVCKELYDFYQCSSQAGHDLKVAKEALEFQLTRGSN